MKCLHINIYDTRGGAAIAACRLHRALVQAHVDSWMLVGRKYGKDPRVIGPASALSEGLLFARKALDFLPVEVIRKGERGIFYPAYLPDRVASRVRNLDPDICHLHWVCGGFLRIESLRRFARPIVWTLHDMWAFTGGCHYDQGCGRYEQSCGECPQLGSTKESDLSRRVWGRKNRAWQNVDITIVTPSRWLRRCARASSLFKDKRVEVIPHGLDTSIYKPADKRRAREALGLDREKKLILFGAIEATSDRRKGFHLLAPALKALVKDGFGQKAELVVFGASGPQKGVELGLKANYVGHLHDDARLALLYASADVMVVPSTQEAFGQTASESLACGTPVVAFATTGLLDVVDHRVNGYLATAFDPGDLAEGIRWVLGDPERSGRLKEAARKKALQEYTLQVQARRYAGLYEEVLHKEKRRQN